VRRLTAAELRGHLDAGFLVLDVREPPMYADVHVRGALNVGLANRSAPYWLDVVAPRDRPLVVVTATSYETALAEELLAIAGREGAGAIVFDADALRGAGVALGSMRTVTPDELAAEPNVSVVDVSERDEYVAGHVPGAVSIPLGELVERLAEAPNGPLALVCSSGFRSSIAASILEARGRGELANVWGGTTAWAQLGHPLASGPRP